MGLNFDGTYTPRSIPADADYPYGSCKNDAVPGDLSGTPGDKDWLNDILGFHQKLLDFGVITPSGVADTILASDYFDGMVKRINRLSQYLVDSGAVNALVITSDPPHTAYFAGMKFRVKIAVTNTGGVTVDADSLGAKSLVKFVSTPLIAGDLPASAIVEMQYDGTNFQIQAVHKASDTLTTLALTGAAPATPVANTLYKDNIIKGWLNYDGIGNVINDDFNVATVTDNGNGDFTINWARAFANGNYALAGIIKIGSGGLSVSLDVLKLAEVASNPTPAIARVRVIRVGGTTNDPQKVTVIAIGAQ